MLVSAGGYICLMRFTRKDNEESFVYLTGWEREDGDTLFGSSWTFSRIMTG